MKREKAHVSAGSGGRAPAGVDAGSPTAGGWFERCSRLWRRSDRHCRPEHGSRHYRPLAGRATRHRTRTPIPATTERFIDGARSYPHRKRVYLPRLTAMSSCHHMMTYDDMPQSRSIPTPSQRRRFTVSGHRSGLLHVPRGAAHRVAGADPADPDRRGRTAFPRWADAEPSGGAPRGGHG